MKRPAVRTIYLLKRAETAVKAGLETALRDLGVTPGQYTTMTLLRTQREISSAELARQVGVTPQSMSEMITVLERKRLIERSETPANKRVLRIGLSPEGAALVKLCDGLVDGLERKLLSHLDPDQLDALRSGLAAIVKAHAPN